MTMPLLDDFRLLGAQFRHAAPADLAPCQNVLACPLQFASDDYAIALPRALSQAPLIQANPPLQQLLRQHAETLLARLPVSASVRGSSACSASNWHTAAPPPESESPAWPPSPPWPPRLLRGDLHLDAERR